MGVKIYIADIETSQAIVRTFSVWNTNILPWNVIREVGILCIAWKEVGSNRVFSSCVGPDKTERQVVAEFREAVDDADILVGHSFSNFDIKHITAKLIEHDLPPFHKLHIVDTLRELKKVAKFMYNRLDYLCQKFFGQAKLPTDNQLWIDCTDGDVKALRKMERYCRHDVSITEALYLKVRPYLRSHPNVADTNSTNCPRCGHGLARMRKEYRTKAGAVRTHMHCLACSAPFTIAAPKPPRPHSAV